MTLDGPCRLPAAPTLLACGLAWLLVVGGAVGTAQAGERPPAFEGLPVSESPEETIARARGYVEQGSLLSAEAVLTAAAQQAPEHHDLQVMLGWVQVWGGKPADGLATFQRILALVPRSHDARRGEVLALSDLEQHRDARRALEAWEGEGGADGGPSDEQLRSLAIELASRRGEPWQARRLAELARSAGDDNAVVRATRKRPIGIDLSGGWGVHLRTAGPMAAWNLQLAATPVEAFRFWGRYEGSVWLGELESRLGGGVHFRTPQGFSVVVDGGVGIPGKRIAIGDIGVGLGWSILKRVEAEFGYSFRGFAGGSLSHLFRLGARVRLGPSTHLLAYGYLGLTRLEREGDVTPAPGLMIAVQQELFERLELKVGYALGTELVLTPAAQPGRFLIHRGFLEANIALHERFSLGVDYAAEVWGTSPVFHTLGVRGTLHL